MGKKFVNHWFLHNDTFFNIQQYNPTLDKMATLEEVRNCTLHW